MSRPAPSTAADAIDRLIDHLHHRVDHGVFDALMSTELTLTQLRVVKLLTETEAPRPISEFAREIGLSLATAGRAVDQLVRAELAERREDPDDRRNRLVRLTDAGRRLGEAPHDAARAGIEAFAEALPGPVADELAAAIDRALDPHSTHVPAD